MLKKFFFICFSIVILGFVIFFFFRGEDENKGSEKVEDTFLQEIQIWSQKGMIMDAPIIAGDSQYNEVAEILGEYENLDETSIGPFAVYPNHQMTIGYRNSVAIDLRSYDKKLQDIHYQEIVDRFGEPDEKKYYQDSEFDQIILIYQVNRDYQLKWILDRPTEQEPNPPVHHTSLVAMETPKQASVSETIKNMSIDEKLGQMIFAGIPGKQIDEGAERLIQEYKVGGIIVNGKNIATPDQTVAYINALKSLNNLNEIPLFFGIDQEGGRIAKLPGDLKSMPTNMEIGQKYNPSLSFEIGSLLGKLVKAYGFNINFAPVLDVNSNPENPVIGDRSFGDNPNVVSELGIATMKGLKSENIIPTIKHFPGHGDTSVDSHVELPTVHKTLAELEEMELIPFKEAIGEGADMVMVAHILLPKIDPDYPSSMSKNIITDLLREKLEFTGVVITDDMTMEAIAGNFDLGRAAVTSVQAGSDIIMVAHGDDNMIKVIAALKKAVENGEIEEERINESVTRILQLKENYHLDDSYVEEVNNDELEQLIEAVHF
ncbi:beta-N-acetylhexosaminidase [Robertmurraya massiliosenegalensis]|uniref:beta-N-acetylhexosaminidase n=1 Tax=Robertmurraya TaxID=2837507 RepID=UPI0039A5D83B